jgi:N-glycosylase/DNA lyase
MSTNETTTEMKTSYQHVEALYASYALRREAIRTRLDEFARVKPEEYLYELIYCLLTPQSSAIHAAKAVERLRALDGLEDTEAVARILAERDHYIRFHRTKAKHICELQRRYAAILPILTNGLNSVELRAWLVRNVKGLGWKEASHFLRNIGHRNLAILDRHILKNLKKHRVIRSIPKTLTPKRYLSLEQKFHRFADAVGIPMDELDLLFWSGETGEILK